MATHLVLLRDAPREGHKQPIARDEECQRSMEPHSDSPVESLNVELLSRGL
jgi:hypothetical protein